MSTPAFLESYQKTFQRIPPAFTCGIALFMFLLLICETIFPSLELNLRLLPSGIAKFESKYEKIRILSGSS